MTDPSATIGPRLKAGRERRGLSVQKAADELLLDAWVIDALEADDYERLGPSVYAKGHLKRYAALLGLPSAEILSAYESRAQAPRASASQASRTPAPQPASVRLRTDAPAADHLPWPSIVGLVAAVLLVGAVFWWKPWHQRGPAAVETVAAHPSAAAADSAAEPAVAVVTSADAAPTMTSTAPAAPTTPPTAAPSPMPGSAAALAPAGGAAARVRATPTPDSDATAGIGRARLRLSFSADSWVDVHDAAGRRVFAGEGRANSVKTLTGTAPMRVYLGFASGVQLEINNRAIAIGPQFVAGDIARFEAGADGVLRRDSRSAPTPGAAAASGPAIPGAAPGAATRSAHPSG
jgi:cytoskeleton protein RodZ